VNVQEGIYGNALQAALAKGYVAIVWMFLENGGDLNA
jgi:hypothetical protein